MGTIFVDNLEPQSGTSLTLGSSGDTVALTSGAKTSGFGKIGQVVSTLLTTQQFTNSTSLVATEAVATITPTSTTSKILIYWDVAFRKNNTNSGTYVNFSLYKNSSLLKPIDTNFSNTMAAKVMLRANYHLLDSPSTTSSTQYAVYWARVGNSESGGFYLNDGGSSAASGSFTLMEVLD